LGPMEIHQLRAGQHPGTGILQCFVTTKNPSVPTSCGLFRADYLVAQKMGEGSEHWQYQWFWPDRSIKADENTARCYSCHQSRQDRQFMFTFTDALSFK
jgi:hypothetical protein